MNNPHPGDADYDDTDDQKAAWLAIAAASLRGFCNKVAERYSEPEQQPEYQLASGLAIYMYELAVSELTSSVIDTITDVGEKAFQDAARAAEGHVAVFLKSLADARAKQAAAQK